MRFLGVDLAWKNGNGSGVVLLSGQEFPLHLRARPDVLASHDEVLDWIARQVRHHRAAIGIDAPLLGLSRRGGRRPCDNAISRAFGRFHASTHTPSHVPALIRVTERLVREHKIEAFQSVVRLRSGRPAVREVCPGALQVHLFDLTRRRGSHTVKYKRRRIVSKRDWVEHGLRPFIGHVREAVEGRYVISTDDLWQEFVAEVPLVTMTSATLKQIEDHWDALLCALAVSLEFLAPGTVMLYPGGLKSLRAGAILAPVLS